jgi:hypothetical protein
MQTIEALTAAAVALLQQASPESVRRVLRALLDEEFSILPAEVRAPAPCSTAKLNGVDGPSAGAMHAVPGAKRAKRRRQAKRPAKQSASADPAWEQLRSELRTEMAERRLDYGAIATAIGMTEATTRLGICRSHPPSPAMMEKLRAWLAASAVASNLRFPGEVPAMAPLPEVLDVGSGDGRICCWEEALSGGRMLRCDHPVLGGRPWCQSHCRRFHAGKLRRGWSTLVDRLT